MISSCHPTFQLSLQKFSPSLNISFLLLSMTKRNHIIQLCQNKPTHITNYCSSLLKSSPSWLRQKIKSETQYTTPERYTLEQPTTTTDKLNNVLTSRTLHDQTQKIPFEQYYRLNVSEPAIALCEIKSSNVFVLAHTSFDQNLFLFHSCSARSCSTFNAVLRDFGFFQTLAPYDPTKHPTQPNSSTDPPNSQPALL